MKTDIQNQVEQVDRIGQSLQTVLVKNQGLTIEVGRGFGDVAASADRRCDGAREVGVSTFPHLLARAGPFTQRGGIRLDGSETG